MRPAHENAPTVQGRGAGSQTNGRGLSPKNTESFDRLQFRLSAFALALDAVLPDLSYLQHVTELAARGGPMPSDCPQRLYRIALKLFDLRVVLESPMPGSTDQ